MAVGARYTFAKVPLKAVVCHGTGGPPNVTSALGRDPYIFGSLAIFPLYEQVLFFRMQVFFYRRPLHMTVTRPLNLFSSVRASRVCERDESARERQSPQCAGVAIPLRQPHRESPVEVISTPTGAACHTTGGERMEL